MNYQQQLTMLSICMGLAGAGAAQSETEDTSYPQKESGPGYCHNYDHSCKTRSVKLAKDQILDISAQSYRDLFYPDTPRTKGPKLKAVDAKVQVFDKDDKVMKTINVNTGTKRFAFIAPEKGIFYMQIAMPNNVENAPYVKVRGWVLGQAAR